MMTLEEAKKIVSDDKSPVYNAADGSPINLKDSFYIKENMIDE